MNISIEPFTIDRISQVKAFNRRMMDGGLEEALAFPESPELDYPVRGAPIWQEAFLALEGEEVRGGYYFTHERYAIGGDVCWIAHYRHPISEVVVNKAYKGLSALLLDDARKRQPLLYCLGMGGGQSKVLRRLRADGWKDAPIPFWFRVAHATKFFRNLAYFRKTPLRRFVFDLAAGTGAGWLGIQAAQAIRAQGSQDPAGHTIEITPDFGPWADELWEINRPLHLLAAVRDRATLNLRYSPENPRLTRITLSAGGQAAGWAVLLEKRMNGNPYFGDMHVGTIVDCLAKPGHERAVVTAAAAQLESAGVDILVSNQSSTAWCEAFRKSGFLSGPSNYQAAFSTELAGRISPVAENTPRFHVNRGDGAGISRL